MKITKVRKHPLL